MAKPVYTTCTCEADLGQLRMAWNGQPNPDLSDIKKRLEKIRMDHFDHDPSIFGQFDSQYAALSDRLMVEQANSLGFVVGRVKKSTGAGMVPASPSSPDPSPQVIVFQNPLTSPTQRPQFTRQDTHIVPASTPKHSASKTRQSGSQSKSSFRISATPLPQSPPKPSSDSSKTPKDHE